MIYYYDFAAERRIGDWRETAREDGRVRIEATFDNARAEEMILLWDEWRPGAPYEPRILLVNGLDAEKQDRCYARPRGCRRGMPIHLQAGRNTVTAELIPRQYRIQDFHMNLIPAPGKTAPVEYHRKWQAPDPEVLPSPRPCPHDGPEWTPGLGRERMPGRFGFTKGDGLLDCAMPWFGIVDKMFLCGHPRWRKPTIWSYSLEQEDAGGTAAADEEVEVNQLAVRWRRGGTTHSYSLASCGIVTERSSGDVRISRLESAGGYRYVLTAGEIASPERFSGEMPENWLLLFGTADFPEVPLLVVLEQRPRRIAFSRLPDGRLHAVEFQGCRKMTTATPFGFASLEPRTPSDSGFLEDATRRCRFWSRAFLAFPVACREYFRIDRKARRVCIVQDFEHRFSRDDWGTVPLELAPLPPMLSLGGERLPDGALDFHLPTKYGDLLGFTGRSSSYSVGMIRPRRKFPLRDARSRIPDLLADGLDEYFDFEEGFPDTIQSYAYPGAILEAYAYGVSLADFMPLERRDLLARRLSERLALACDPDRRYTLLLTDHSRLLRTKPPKEEVRRYYLESDIGRLGMFNLYRRREPFTSQTYRLCYFNVSMMNAGEIRTGIRQEVLDYPRVFVENDWGIGLTLYLTYSAALFSGDWSAIRRHWDSLKDIFRFFDLFQDWACMGAGYAEKSRTWIEGANFGAFTAFQNLAGTLGDTKAEEYCIYLGAKMLNLCRGRFFSGPYLARCYGEPAWYGNRFFQEEASPEHLFQHVPPPQSLRFGRVLPGGVSLLTTDAIYPEFFESFRETAPAPHRDMMDRYRNALRAGMHCGNNIEFSYLLVNDALDPRIPPESVRQDLALAKSTGRLLTEWHDIHRFENFLPRNHLEAQILAWLEMRGQPLWLEHWQGMRIRDAVWNDGEAGIEIVLTEPGPQPLFCGIRREFRRLSFSDGIAEAGPLEDGKIRFLIPSSGILTISF